MNGAGKWFADNVEMIVGSTIALIGIAVALLVYLWQRKPKQLDYRVVNNVRVLTEHAASLNKLAMVYDGVHLKDPRIVTVRIQNTGKVAVTREDYVQPITVNYELVEAYPFDGFISDESTPGICEELFEPAEDDARIEPLVLPKLMNPGDWLGLLHG